MKELNTLTEKQIANLLRDEILKDSVSYVKLVKKNNTKDMEYISSTKQEYISPIMTMSEDEILAFVEEFGVNELATLSVQELNHIGEVLGVEPNILTQGME